MPVIALIRHGETDWNVQQRVQGASDIPLNANGHQQAEVLAERIATDTSISWHGIYSSPLGRAVQTATPLAQRLGLPLQQLPEFTERNFGKGEGLVWAEIHERYGDTVPGRESLSEIRARTLPALFRIITEFPNDNRIILSHGGTIRTVLLALSRGSFPPSGVAIPNTGVYQIHFEANHLWIPDHEMVSIPELLADINEESRV